MSARTSDPPSRQRRFGDIGWLPAFQEQLDARLLRAPHVFANGVLSGGRVSGLDRIDNGAMFWQCGFPAGRSSAAGGLKEQHRRLDIFQHLQYVPVVGTVVDSFMKTAIVIDQLSGVIEDLFL